MSISRLDWWRYRLLMLPSWLRHRLLGALSAAYRRLPLSFEQRTAIRNIAFRHGRLFLSDTLAYQQWRAHQDRLASGEGPPASIPAIGQRSAVLETLTREARPAILMITHDQGGGTEAHIQQLAAAVDESGWKAYVLRTYRDGMLRIESACSPQPSETLLLTMAECEAELRQLLPALNIQHIHLHHGIDLPDTLLFHLPALTQELGLEYDFTAHDYFPICPRYGLFDEAVRGYCGEPAVERCTVCINTYGSPVGKDIDVALWRERYRELAENARFLFVPNPDAGERLTRYFPKANIQWRSHFDRAPKDIPAVIPRQEDEPLRVAIIGAISPGKGSMVLANCARDAKKRGLAIEFNILGHTDIDWLLRPLPHVVISGRYEPDLLPDMIRNGQYHLAFFPGVWPETYCYTFSEAIKAGLYPVCFDIGAIAERIRRLDWGHILPYPLYQHADRINDALLSLTPTQPRAEVIQNHFVTYDPFMQEYYALDTKQPQRKAV